VARPEAADIGDLIGSIPHRLALAGGWIDQPFISARNPDPPGSMVVVSLEPDRWFMDRAGIASGTRKVALRIWNGVLPDRPREQLVRELYQAENDGRPEPSGSQDMIGLIYPGVSRLDYDAAHEGGYFPVHVESNCDRDRSLAGARPATGTHQPAARGLQSPGRQEPRSAVDRAAGADRPVLL
jgi:hypothetical protein